MSNDGWPTLERKLYGAFAAVRGAAVGVVSGVPRVAGVRVRGVFCGRPRVAVDAERLNAVFNCVEIRVDRVDCCRSCWAT